MALVTLLPQLLPLDLAMAETQLRARNQRSQRSVESELAVVGLGLDTISASAIEDYKQLWNSGAAWGRGHLPVLRKPSFF